MKKILIVVTDTNFGGVTTAAYNLANVLIGKGHSVDILDMSGAYQEADRLNEKIRRLFLKGRSRFWEITAKESNGLGKLPHKLLGAFKKLTIRSGIWYKLIFSKFQPDTVYDAALAFRQCAPCYSFVHNKVNAKKKIGFIHGEKKYMGDISSWDKYFKVFDNIACVSNYVRGEFATEYPALSDKFCCVYNTFNIDSIRHKAEDKTDIVFDKSKVNLVTVARIDNAFKQIDMIPIVCRKLFDKGFDAFHWYVIGDGPDLEKDMSLAQDLEVAEYITFTGMQSNPFPVLKNADLYVGTSKSEAYSMTIKEAHILGVPVLSTNYSSAYEAVSHGKNGYLTENTVDALSDGLFYLLQNDAVELSALKKRMLSFTVNNDISYDQLMRLLN